MELERYNQSFEEHVDIIEDDADNRLRSFRQQCVRNFINNFTQHQREWEATFNDLLCKSQELDPQDKSKLVKDTKSLEQALNLSFGITKDKKDERLETDKTQLKNTKEEQNTINNNSIVSDNNNVTPKLKELDPRVKKNQSTVVDPFPVQYSDYFTNNLSLKEFVRIQRQLESNRQQSSDLYTNPQWKPFKNEINLFIRTQINSISNSSKEHLDTKTRLLTALFKGQPVSFQDRLIQASHHPFGQLYAMDLAAQTFVTVGTRLVNSVPAIAKSMATVINDIIATNDSRLFDDLIIGNLQERCPFLVPMYPDRDEFETGQTGGEVRYKIACGYAYDQKAQTIETEEKYLARMRSMVLIYACLLAGRPDKQLAWTWLASFLSLKPEPVTTATVLQAYLQEISKPMSRAFGRQYKKLLDFVKIDYVKMIEQVTPNPSDRQSLIKLKNLLADESSLIAAPAMGSIFGAVRFG